MPLHDTEELDDDLGGRPDQDLALASLLGVVDGIKRIVENTGLDHFDGDVRFSLCDWDNEVSVERSWVSLQEPRAKRVPFGAHTEGSSARVAKGEAYHREDDC